MTETEDLLEGLVVRSQSGFYTVHVGDRTLVCSLPGRFKQGRRTEKSPLVIGDRVVVRPGQDQEGAIERILPRRNELARAAAGGVDLKHVLAANLDLVILAFALHEPDLNTPRLDRFLLATEQAEIPAVIVITKLDLGNVEDAERILRPYRDIGYPVLLTSARTGLGMEAIRETLAGKISAIIGSSGVGKSSLLNALQPGLALRFAEISLATGKGRHTTTVADLLPLDFGGYLADTPGLRELAPWDLDPEEVPLLFPEMRPYLDACRFARCTHLHEPGCAVRRALEEGLIDSGRYRSYTRIRADSVQNAEPPGRRG